jgi:Alginate lyase
MALPTDHRTVNRRTLAIVVGALVIGGGLLWLGLGMFRTEPPAGGGGGGGRGGTSSVDLEGWKLTLPVEGKSGNAAIVDPAAVTDPWLTASPDGGLTFWAPAEGATTKNSQHPRTELNSLTNFSAGTDGKQTLSATLAVSQVPEDSKDIIVGQIHGADDISSVPYVMVHYRDGEIRVVVKQQQKGDEKQSFSLLTGVPLNDRFDITITDEGNGSMTIGASHAGNTQQVTAQVPAAFHGQTVRFQVGDYQQAESANGADDGGRVTFYRIDQSSGS